MSGPIEVKCPDCKRRWNKATRNKSNRCSSCRRTWEIAWRKRRKIEDRPVVTPKMPRQWHREYEAIYRERPGKRATAAKNQKRYRSDPTLRPRHKARWMVNRAVAAGTLKRQSCEICGIAKTQAHHDDYFRPLKVRWLCAAHHAAIHAKAEGRASCATSAIESL